MPADSHQYDECSHGDPLSGRSSIPVGKVAGMRVISVLSHHLQKRLRRVAQGAARRIDQADLALHVQLFDLYLA